MKVVAYTRAEIGTGASRRLRAAGMAPGIVYGGNSEPVNIKLDHNALFYALKREAFHSSILDLEIVHHATTELEISCLPAHLPSFIEVDLANLDVGQAIHLADLKLPEGVSATSHDESQPIVTATVANVAESEEEVSEEAAPAADAETKE